LNVRDPERLRCGTGYEPSYWLTVLWTKAAVVLSHQSAPINFSLDRCARFRGRLSD
jgi:hypothetical protein